jgi:hypothetical protein
MVLHKIKKFLHNEGDKEKTQRMGNSFANYSSAKINIQNMQRVKK